ncbi:unnamed protein product [Soboliphyme baturini]|uniref:HTH CENPB-type domain-containing protein n=1 Tax=Soboliphyme baturini TaxID=241478 RepID=A0A183J4J0_9BILA|nr:unnamed protein product [Soboliphyme baturini]
MVLLLRWKQCAKVKNCPVDQNTVCNQAKPIFERSKEEAGEAGKDENFVAGDGWINRFKTRCNWHSIAEGAETAIADKEAASPFPETLMAMIEEDHCSSERALNVDKSGLFWKKMPKTTFIARVEKIFQGLRFLKTY